ncbi:hypothetical protein AS9A_2016 [Hoyosella subflava DQS3-9A1]|uniref:Uncharacterized protein n=1 Tax=Hoyosella subflava (strain DSM 45089 / JCM 17490 / NBRC 109087 / DQS3-9A1) TaxID=443218 RepID=F6ENZ9_HOYSD|nr:hypothetical protein AS9A_2016 [Hoyosella subflava DQS3-9A1]
MVPSGLALRFLRREVRGKRTVVLLLTKGRGTQLPVRRNAAFRRE